MNRAIFLILSFFLLCSCQEKSTFTFSFKGDTYELKFPKEWKIGYTKEEYGKEEYLPPMLGFAILDKEGKPTGRNVIEIYTEETNECPPLLEENSKNNESNECDEGPEFTPIFKKDKVSINGVLMDRWYNEKCSKILRVYSKPKENRCVLFSMSFFDSDPKIEKEFYEVIKSFRLNNE